MAALGWLLPLHLRRNLGGHGLRWDLTVDKGVRQALLQLAENCPTTTVVHEPAR
ncbi:hypothetical protein [Streptomyces sp. MS2.AVA.5]|uniref:Uncharacterized protein n=1 Tax=Streptomyces achmelvichensis TaxID=3134111 RepID=A0ACC6Q7Y7_9ACTN